MTTPQGTISEEQIAEWKKLKGKGMVSAVGEYTPDEFWLVLDELERLRGNGERVLVPDGYALVPVGEAAELMAKEDSERFQAAARKALDALNEAFNQSTAAYNDQLDTALAAAESAKEKP